MGARNWTKEEIDYLSDNWGKYTIPRIAENLNRTVNAVKCKAVKLGLGRHIHNGDYLTVNQFMLAVRPGKGSNYTLQQWMDKGLPVKKRKSINLRYRVIDIDDFWKWAENNRTLIDFSKMEENILGVEPDWVAEQRAADNLKHKLFKTDPWSPLEDAKLVHMLSKYKYSYNEISMTLRRTEGAIVRRMSDLDIKMRPIKADNHNPWTPEEVDRLKELYHKGYESNCIAYLLGTRGAKAVEGKIERLIKKKKLVSIKHKKCA